MSGDAVMSGDVMPGDEMPGDVMPGDEMSGDEMSDGDRVTDGVPVGEPSESTKMSANVLTI